MLRVFIMALFALGSFQAALAQYFQSTNFKEGSGLPSSESYMVFQDSRGFVWIGTDNGVVKYDGHEFVTYNLARGLTDNTVFGFYEDWKHRIWFRTYSGEISYIEGDEIHPYKYNKELRKALNSSILLSIYPDSLGNLYFSTTLHAIAAKIDSTGQVHTFWKHEDKWNFIHFQDDKLMVGSSGIPRNMTSIMINDKEYPIRLDDPMRQSNSLISCVKWHGKLYFSLHTSIFAFDGESVKKVYRGKNPFICLYVDRENRLWVGNFNGGVEVFRDETFLEPFRLQALAELSVSSILQDTEDGIWVSTLDQGVFYFPNLTVENYQPPNNTKISAVASDNDQVFIGSYDGDVFRIGPKGEMSRIYEGSPPISYLFVDKGKSLWISDASGTYILSKNLQIGGKGNPSTAFKGMLHVDNGIMAYNSMGIFKLSNDGTVMEKLESRKRPTAMVVVDKDVFLGGLHGLDIYQKDFSQPARRVTETRISSLMAVDDNYVMVGTTGEGLHVYNRKNGQLSHVPVADVSNVYSIICDKARRTLWIGTEKGLYQLNFLKGDSTMTVDHFSKAAGLISTKINTVCKVGDNIWAISDLGISSVPLHHFSSGNPVPVFYVNRILFKNELMTSTTPVISAQEGNMVVDVRAITFKGYPVAFRYRLNQDQSWQAMEGSSIFLSGLRPDRYNLEIQASSGSDNWTKSLVLTIHVLSAWWETWTFRVGALALIAMLVFIIYRVRMNTIRRRQNYLELINLHQQKLIDSEIRTQERERKRIATDLHDGIGASLSSIKILISDAMSDEKSDRIARGKEINENLTDVIDDIKRIVYDLHPPGLERYGLQSALKNLADRLNKSGEVKIIFDYYGQRDVVQPVSITIFRIIQELINNTLKHARATEIRIHINQFDDEINIMYEDNGIGMIGSRFTGLGLHSIESRVRSLNGRMSWESNHKGTFYNFDIPF